jgi:hypothetical protein
MVQRLRALSNIPESRQIALAAEVFDSQLLTPAAVDRLLSQGEYGINTDHNRWIEYATPRYNWADDDGSVTNLAWLKSFAEPSTAAAAR